MSNVTSIGLNSLDNLFGDNEDVEKAKTDIALGKLKPFTNHPFSLYSSEELNKLADSIKTHGLFTPIIVRPIEDEQFTHEIVAGHNRVEACKLAGLKTIACDVRDLDDTLATIIMVDTNLNQRQYIKPSEKAKAYQMRKKAIESQGKRNDLTCRQVVDKLKSVDIIGKDNNESGRQVQRFIRLNNLTPELLEKVDDKKLAFTSAIELSYLPEEKQNELYDILDSEEKYGVPMVIASKLRGIATNGNLTKDKIENLITTSIKKQPKAYKISYTFVSKYFENNVTPKEVNETIDKALKLWREKYPISESTENNKNQPTR